MSVTVRDIMKLPCMKDAEIVAGEGGLDNLVTAVSVLEYSSYSDIQEKVFSEQNYEGSDIVITAFASIADSQEKILSEIKDSYDIGEAGVIIYYFDLFVKELSPEVLDYANEVGYPIILMPRDQFQLRYSEAISEISELLLEDRSKADNFTASIMERFLSLPKNQQNATTLLRLLSSYLHLTLILADSNWKLTAFAGWPSTLERVAEENLKKILDGNYEGPFNVITLEDIPGGKMELIVTGNDALRKSTMEQITDVVRLYLKMSADEVTDAYGTTQLIRAIIGDEPVKMRRLAGNMGVNAGRLRNMIIFREPRFNMIRGETFLGDIKDLLGRYCRDCVVDIYSGDAVAFLDDGLSSQWLPALRMLNEMLRERGLDPICVYARNLADPAEVREAYLKVVANFDETRKLYPKASIFSYHEIMFVADLKEHVISQGEDRLRKEMEALRFFRYGGEEQARDLIETLTSFYFDSGQSVSRTAENLFIHVNTVKYRLKKISEVMGCKVTEMPEMIELYKALALNRLIQ